MLFLGVHLKFKKLPSYQPYLYKLILENSVAYLLTSYSPNHSAATKQAEITSWNAAFGEKQLPQRKCILLMY